MMGPIYDAFVRKGGPECQIPNVGRKHLPQFFKEMGYTTGVEIGVCKGGYSKMLCEAGLKVYGVDPYRTYPGYDGPGYQERLDAEMTEAVQLLAPFDWTLIRKTSMEAAKDFEDGSLDFVYIDGHHEFKYITEDLYEWSKKVKKGGCISGHDFVFSRKPSPMGCHVKQVVRAWTEAHDIKNWYVLGSLHFPPPGSGEYRDQWRSWFWINE